MCRELKTNRKGQYRQQRDAQFDLFYDKFLRSEEVIRQRFISFFKRGVLHRPSEKDYSLIRLGNEVAHHGNAYRDAHLYSTGSRTDSDVFEELYGFRPLKVLNIDRKAFPDPQRRENANNGIATSEGLWALNQHATRFADEEKGLPSKEFHVTFSKFTQAHEAQNFPVKFLHNNTSSLTTLYWEFMHHCH